jgi:hypothetical protein
MLALLLAAITVSTNFEAGSVGRVEVVSPTHLRCPVVGESDQDKRNRQASWYYFRLDGLPSTEVVIELTDLVGEYNYRPGTHPVSARTRPVYSYDQRAWQHFSDREVEWDEKEIRLRLRFTPTRRRMWIAHVPPYTTTDLRRLLRVFQRHPHLRSEVVGKTVHGRDMTLLTVTNPGKPEQGKKIIWLMFRQHAWEASTSHVCEGALRFLLSRDPEAVRLRDEVIWKIFPMADPDGVARGGVRFNAHGYDLNRNWDAVDPVKMPEIAAQRKAILDWVESGRRIDFFMAFHNTENAEFIEGPIPDSDNEFRRLAERTLRLLSETTSFHATRPLRASGASTTPGQPGRMAVYQGLYHERKVPALLMEQMVEYNSKLGRLPTVSDCLRFGAELARALAAAVAGAE